VIADSQTSLQYLKDQVATFARDREWDQFHSPKNLSMALAVEAGELIIDGWQSLDDALLEQGVPKLRESQAKLRDILDELQALQE
jgi:hypothetical protein